MEKILLAEVINEKYIVRVYGGPSTDTPEKLRALLEPAAISFANAIRKRNPELFESLGRPVTNDNE